MKVITPSPRSTSRLLDGSCIRGAAVCFPEPGLCNPYLHSLETNIDRDSTKTKYLKTYGRRSHWARDVSSFTEVIQTRPDNLMRLWSRLYYSHDFKKNIQVGFPKRRALFIDTQSKQHDTPFALSRARPIPSTAGESLEIVLLNPGDRAMTQVRMRKHCDRITSRRKNEHGPWA